jgi:hypothetical protein
MKSMATLGNQGGLRLCVYAHFVSRAAPTAP